MLSLSCCNNDLCDNFVFLLLCDIDAARINWLFPGQVICLLLVCLLACCIRRIVVVEISRLLFAPLGSATFIPANNFLLSVEQTSSSPQVFLLLPLSLLRPQIRTNRTSETRVRGARRRSRRSKRRRRRRRSERAPQFALAPPLYALGSSVPSRSLNHRARAPSPATTDGSPTDPIGSVQSIASARLLEFTGPREQIRQF